LSKFQGGSALFSVKKQKVNREKEGPQAIFEIKAT